MDDNDLLDLMMKEMNKKIPVVAETFVHERDMLVLFYHYCSRISFVAFFIVECQHNLEYPYSMLRHA